ncbi:MAG TPA: hypothetical protein PKE25_13460, partial [Novosphingobium sp.]|nr:hypothetical protein [Novosphingobium sp.]
AADAQIAANINAQTITVVNDAPSGNVLRLGDATGATGFVLSNAEAGRLRATGTLTFDAGTATRPQDVEIGVLDLSVPAAVSVLAKGTRIDLIGKLSVTGNTKTLTLGSPGTGNLASILRIRATADGSGGQIAAAGADVLLNAGNIVAGQDAGFATALGAISGTGSATVATEMNSNSGSALYFAGNGGTQYAATGVSLLTARRLSVSYTGFALFQNTGAPGQTSGLLLDATPTVALDLASPATTPVFGMFGTINGRPGTAAALLGAAGLNVGYGNISASRINGCIIGGGNCLSVQTITPAITGIDAVRGAIVYAAPDFEVPFDPLIGTNNDALIGDVGPFGVSSGALTPIECSDPNTVCTRQEDGK